MTSQNRVKVAKAPPSKKGTDPVDNPPENTEEDKKSDGMIGAIIWAAAVAIIIRSLVVEPFSIPSGSMFPTLKVGDYLFVTKYSYGYGKYSFPLGLIDFDGRIFEDYPERGDIAVFRKPYEEHVDYIKRVVGLPGDEVQMIDGQLHLNGQLVARDFQGMDTHNDRGTKQTYHLYHQTLPDTNVTHQIYELSDVEPLDFTMRVKIPDGFVFAMGDNRDESLDSRAIDSVGLVPIENMVGRAAFFFFSVEPSGTKCIKEGGMRKVRSFFCKVGNLPTAIRWDRIFRPVHRSVE